MKISSFLLIGILFGLLACEQTSSVEREINETITRIRETYAPDQREALFQVELSTRDKSYILAGETNLAEAKSALLKQLHRYPIIDSIDVLPNQLEKQWGLTILPVSNLRSKPEFRAELVTQALLGTPIQILKREKNWSLVQTPDKYISWLINSSIHEMDSAQFESWKSSDRLLINADMVPIFQKADVQSPLLSTVFRGSLVVLVGQQNNFSQIKLPNGKIGFTEEESGEHFENWNARQQMDIERMYHLANQLVGRSYLWGGTAPTAMDCSGFTKTLYWSQGIILARDASLQVQHGEPIPLDSAYSKLQPGDLLFFGHRQTEQEAERVSHVAFYLGNQEYIHASGLVKINSLDPTSELYDDQRAQNLLYIRRIAGQENTAGIQRVSQHPWYN